MRSYQRRGHRACGQPWQDIEATIAMARRGFEDWGGDGFGASWGAGRGHGGRRRRFAGSELRLVLLKLIADEPRHGYELMKALEELTGGAYAPSPGTVYPTLSLLEDEGAIEASAGETAGTRKAFAATEAGRAELADKAEEVDALMARLAELGGSRERERGHWPELWRAMTNLGGVLKNRLRNGGLEGDAIREMVDVIDEAARRIERM